MATLTIKNIPDRLYRRLKQTAERNRRSLNSEIIVNLELAVGSTPFDPKALLARARALRERAPGLFVTDRDLRQAKDQGRA